MEIFKTSLIILFSFYIVLVGLLTIFQRKLIFFPDKNLTLTPADIRVEFTDLYLETKSHSKINAWFMEFEDAEYTILLCHGNAGNMSNRLELIPIFKNLGVNILFFDYSGYGLSEGTPSEANSYDDVEAAWQWLTSEQNIPEQKIIIYGRSLGGPIAAWLATQKRPAGLVLHATFTSVSDFARRLYPSFIVNSILNLTRFPTLDYVKKSSAPLLVIHSLSDDIVPFVFSQQLFEAASNPKTFLEIIGSHNDDIIVSEDTVLKGLEVFIRSLQK